MDHTVWLLESPTDISKTVSFSAFTILKNKYFPEVIEMKSFGLNLLKSKKLKERFII